MRMRFCYASYSKGNLAALGCSDCCVHRPLEDAKSILSQLRCVKLPDRFRQFRARLVWSADPRQRTCVVVVLSIMSRSVSRPTPHGPHALSRSTSPHAGLCDGGFHASSGQALAYIEGSVCELDLWEESFASRTDRRAAGGQMLGLQQRGENGLGRQADLRHCPSVKIQISGVGEQL